jgi:hypothetical protein
MQYILRMPKSERRVTNNIKAAKKATQNLHKNVQFNKLQKRKQRRNNKLFNIYIFLHKPLFIF